MNRGSRFGLLSLFLLIFYSLSWLALWTISFYLNDNGQQAALLLPQGLRLALFILLGRRYLPTLLATEIAILLWLGSEQLITHNIILLSPFLSLIPTFIVQQFWWRYPLYWQRLSILLAGVAANSLLQAVCLGFALTVGASHLFLTSLTGGVLLSPFVYLIYEYLRQQHLKNILQPSNPDPQLRPSLLMWCCLFCLLGLSAQIFMSPEIENLLVILIFIPNVFMAYRYGWQGGVLAALLGSLMITSARQFNGAFNDLGELEMFLTIQALLGIGLGIAISRQQQLAENLQRYRELLEQELTARHNLMKQLVHTEEDVCKSIARELHDEIGQNITAIQIQATLIKRTATTPATEMIAEQINKLAQQIHQSTRQLLRQLRPPVLEEMSLEKALHHLIHEFAFKERDIDCQLNYQIPQNPTNETVVFTLYRLVQELLNNISKHAKATRIAIILRQRRDVIELRISDNGIGITEDKRKGGLGLQGIEERIRALGGDWQLSNDNGTRIIVKLPTNSDENQA
ncbi:histidine kinase [Photorhabdus luminescens subsp. luminescens]|uniref:Two-component system, NarL family, sensor histidine kinase UhpB n=1 Tax=Photorhabdus luminescens TaxID=29488 RepID=A0A1G5QJN7_PHOLU|nr:MASE1 domain-containing protein [Photorhabdus luminescens]KMW73538.1 histidine kinase [Photorhabdus luminescens subsp. luminescens]SCZ61818.1 two-component system, NarL family, sensor histidine kinase UhpB [Photorhabdus luminescens]